MNNSKNQFTRFLLLSIASISSFASEPTPSVFNGKVVDSQNNHPLSNASIYFKELNLTTISDTNGSFSFQSLMPGIYTVITAAQEYDSTIVPNIIVKSKINDLLIISMHKKASQILEEMVVVGNSFDGKKIDQFHSVTRLSNFELNNTPATFNDINRTIQFVPGVSNQSSSDYFNDFLVRGGDPSENIFLVDNIELENPNHFGVFGTNGGYLNLVNSAFVRELDFYTGSIPVKYSPRLSSVTDIRLREGSLLNRKYNIEFNNMMLGFATEGPLPKKVGSYLIDGQAFNMNFMKNFMNWGNVPALHNYQSKFYFPVGDNQAIMLNALGAYDKMNKDDEEMRTFIGETQKSLIYSQHGSAIQWHLFKNFFHNELIASFIYRRLGDEENFTKVYKNKFDFKKVAEFSDIRKTIQLKNNCSVFFDDKNLFDMGISLERKYFGINERANCIDDYQFWKFNRFVITDQWLESYITSTGDDSTYSTGDTFTSFSGLNQAPLQRHKKIGDRIGGYLNYIFNNDPVKFGIGFRSDYYTLLHKTGNSPRTFFSCRIGSLGTLSADAGLFYQFSTFLEPWLFSSYTGGSLSPFILQRCSQGGIGFDKTFKQTYHFSFESYFKWYDREFSYADPDGPELIGTLITNDQQDLQNLPEQDGRKRSYGIELSLKKVRLDKFYFSIGYSLNITENKYTNNKWYPDAQNHRNSGFCILGSNYFKHHGFAITINGGEGVPYSTMKTVRDSSVWDNGSIHYFYILQHLDEHYWMHKRFDPYLLIGFRYSFRVFPAWGNITGYIDVQNLLNKRVPYGLDFNENTGEITFLNSSGLLPMLGVIFDF